MGEVSNLYFVDQLSKAPDVRRIKLFVVMDIKENDNNSGVGPNALTSNISNNNNNNNSNSYMMNELDEDDIEHAGIIVFDVSLSLVPNKSFCRYRTKVSKATYRYL
jgi:hypothetical protein